MKLLIVLSIQEYREQVASLLQRAGVKRFSAMNITGHKKSESNIGWFAANSGNAKTNSLMLFSFTSQEVSNQVIESINSYNTETDNPFPIHAFVVDVENFSKII
ncbi:MAG: hypothetical protein LBE56_08355 [Tannerella sp.]|jgi:nitrogen regulatory protein PII|nr:hypothetical protein [Tannerella sp.]